MRNCLPNQTFVVGLIYTIPARKAGQILGFERRHLKTTPNPTAGIEAAGLIKIWAV
jgi:hypothetical protein